ncbi:MAG: hypothetical protein JWP92_650 [Caulobacter sp.]|nr:hypothetical protein [Caulobacter sp.]
MHSFKLICLGSAKRLTQDGSGILVPEVVQPDNYNGI